MAAVTRDTKLADLLKEYPWMREEAYKISDKFKMLDTPVGKLMLKKMTVADLSKYSGLDEKTIIDEINGMIGKHKDRAD